MNSISGVMIPWRAYQSCVTGRPWLARNGWREEPAKYSSPPRAVSDFAAYSSWPRLRYPLSCGSTTRPA